MTTFPGFKSPNELTGAISAIGQAPITFVSPSDPGTLSSSTSAYKMAGIGITFTPIITGRVIILCYGLFASDTSSDGALVQIAYGTGAAPAANAAAAGTQTGNVFSTGATGTTKVQGTMMAGVNLTPGTTYWLDLAAEAITGGNANLTKLSFLIVEL